MYAAATLPYFQACIGRLLWLCLGAFWMEFSVKLNKTHVLTKAAAAHSTMAVNTTLIP